jgi:pyruvate formate lyase activating enzyme
VAFLATGAVFDIQRYSIHDGPGIRTTVFLKGCQLSCKWCHNPEGQSAKPELIFRENRCGRCGACLAACTHGAISWSGGAAGGAGAGRRAGAEGVVAVRGDGGTGAPVTDRAKCVRCGECAKVCFSGARELIGREMSVGQVVAEAERDAPFYEESGGGVTLSGGEPLAQPEFARELLADLKKMGIHTALDTCGFAEWDTIDMLRRYVDLFLYDLKLMDDLRHRDLVGVSNAGIIRNLSELSQLGHNVILRLPIIPGVNEDDASIRKIGAFAAGLTRLISVDVLPYHHIGTEKYRRLGRPYALEGLAPPSAERMTEIARTLAGYGLAVNRRADAH